MLFAVKDTAIHHAVYIYIEYSNKTYITLIEHTVL